MRFCTFVHRGRTRIGVQQDETTLVDLREAGKTFVESGVLDDSVLPLLAVPDLKGWLSFGEQAIEVARAILTLSADSGRGIYTRNDSRLLACLPNPGKIIAVGLNYRKHAEEQGAQIPETPMIFAKFPSSVIGPDEPIKLPSISRKVDVEAELCAVITRRCRHSGLSQASSSLAYTIGNDVSARDLQYADRQWVRGKSCDTFAPIGPWLVTADEVGDPQNLELELKVNEEVRQKANTGDMIFGCAALVEFLSQCITLEPGDIIFTGTPSGVGVYREPPVFLQAGDLVTVTINKLGVLRNPVVTDLP